VFGVYVHIPFCDRRCDYCAFATWTDRHHLMSSYAAACRQSLALSAVGRAATSVFFGGGTPSLLPGPELVSILALIPRVPGAEVTVECNPSTVTPSLLSAYRRGGVTRLSFGAQSMVSHVLEGLGRDHDPAMVRRAVSLAVDFGFEWSVDLIYGGAGESMSDWVRSVESVLAMSPSHVSAYALTVEAGTPLARDRSRHPDDDDQADKYELADSMFASAGLSWYEISNWARPGHECRHNQLYWEQGDYLGIGCAAHSHVDGRRWWNVRTPERFISLVSAGASVEAGCESLDADGRELEALQLLLRTRRGVPASWLPSSLVSSGLVCVRDGRAVLTLRGRLLANVVAGSLERPALSARPG
jgi:oxygen-independent coproporphyrinogen-3 oxidase